MQKLPLTFYERENVLEIARDLLGKIVVTDINGNFTSGRIVETEAYIGTHDRASHAFGGRRTRRNEHMYHPPATIYMYIIYGVHPMFNISTNRTGVPDAILIRAIEPMEGLEIMSARTGKSPHDKTITRGPGNTARALGLTKSDSGKHLLDQEIFVADDGFVVSAGATGISARIGVESAGDDALKPYRYFVKNNPYVSGKRTSA